MNSPMTANVRVVRPEVLEERAVMSLFGMPWLDHQNITVSFVNDGTRIQTSPSNLFSHMSSLGISQQVWQSTMLRAFQTWASVSNINIGLVQDTSTFLNIATPGLPQGDKRFGDIRIAARPMNDTVLAITTPPGLNTETRAGDIILNSNYRFSTNNAPGTYDLYTVMLQEVGHALGIGNNKTTSSVMYEYYQGARTQLDTSDITAVRNMYQSRQQDSFDRVTRNDTLATATAFPRTAGTSTLFLRGDLNRTTDVDHYTFTTPGSLSEGVRIVLNTAGLSLANATFQIYSQSDRLLYTSPVASANAVDVRLNNLTPNTTYKIRIAGAQGNFSVGAYTLKIIFSSTAVDPQVQAPIAEVVDRSTNESFRTATVLPTVDARVQKYGRISARIESTSDVDIYRFDAPTINNGRNTTLTFSVNANATIGIPPKIQVFDGNFQPVDANLVSSEGFRAVYQITGVTSNQVFYFRVSSHGLPFWTEYTLQAVYQNVSLNFEEVANKQLTSKDSNLIGTLRVDTAQVMSFQVALSDREDVNLNDVYLELYDANRTRILNVPVSWTNNTNFTAFLTPGEYTVQIRSKLENDAAVQVSLRLSRLTDPIDIMPSDPLTVSAQDVQEVFPLDFSWIAYLPEEYEWLFF